MSLLLALALAAPLGPGDAPTAVTAEGSARFALRAAKALTCADAGAGVIIDPIVFVEGGKIVALGRAGEVVTPAGWGDDWTLVDVGEAWLTPGLIDLHSHVGGSRGDINDMVLQTNPGLRVAPTVMPANDALSAPIAAGVTTILYIPGSGTNIGGQGVLMKLGHDRYEDALLRDPGSLKIAQGDNPTRWGFGMRRGLMAWNLVQVLQRGRAYADAWREFDEGHGPRPERCLDLDVFRSLYSGATQVSTHTQYYHLVLTTITMLARDFGLPAYIDHGSFDSYLTAPLALQYGVGVILGPREIMPPTPPRFDTDGRFEGTAWGWQQHGVTEVGFNTDAPVVPQEDLPTQAAMGVCFGLSNERAQGLRGVTIVPARTAGIAHRVGSLEVGKDADILVASGDPIDPRTTIHSVFVDGALFYDAQRDGRRW